MLRGAYESHNLEFPPARITTSHMHISSTPAAEPEYFVAVTLSAEDRAIYSKRSPSSSLLGSSLTNPMVLLPPSSSSSSRSSSSAAAFLPLAFFLDGVASDAVFGQLQAFR